MMNVEESLLWQKAEGMSVRFIPRIDAFGKGLRVHIKFMRWALIVTIPEIFAKTPWSI